MLGQSGAKKKEKEPFHLLTESGESIKTAFFEWLNINIPAMIFWLISALVARQVDHVGVLPYRLLNVAKGYRISKTKNVRISLLILRMKHKEIVWRKLFISISIVKPFPKLLPTVSLFHPVSSRRSFSNQQTNTETPREYWYNWFLNSRRRFIAFAEQENSIFYRSTIQKHSHDSSRLKSANKLTSNGADSIPGIKVNLKTDSRSLSNIQLEPV